jgi:uridine phosphorylase
MSRLDTIHLRPTAPLAERVLLPGDPGRALALAQLLIAQPKMFNHHRGLWGYTGAANADGQPLTIQSTGMGGPSAAIVLHELIALGARRAVRVGTCGALDRALALGDLIVAREAIAADGTSAALSGARGTGTASGYGSPPPPGPAEGAGVSPRTHSHAELGSRLGAIVGSAERPAHLDATIVSTDLFYEEADTDRGGRWRAEGAVAVEMEASALFAVGARAGVEVACLLAVSDTFDAHGVRTRIDDHALQEAAEAMGRAAVAALAGAPAG